MGVMDGLPRSQSMLGLAGIGQAALTATEVDIVQTIEHLRRSMDARNQTFPRTIWTGYDLAEPKKRNIREELQADINKWLEDV